MFDYDMIAQTLQKNEVTVEWCDTIVDTEGKSPGPGWGLTWKHGFIHIGPCPEIRALEAAAMFVHLYLKGVSAQLSSHLIVSWAFIEEYREAIEMYEGLINDIETFTREGLDLIHGSMKERR